MIMNNQVIGIRELHNTIPEIIKKISIGGSFIVMKNTMPVFKIVPLSEEKKEKKYTLEDLQKLSFYGEKDLSSKVDEIAYY